MVVFKSRAAFTGNRGRPSIECKAVQYKSIIIINIEVSGRTTTLMAMKFTFTDMHAQPALLGKQKDKVQSIPIGSECM